MAQLVECLPRMHEVWVGCLAPQLTGIVMHVCTILGRQRQDNQEFKVILDYIVMGAGRESLGCMRLCLNKTK